MTSDQVNAAIDQAREAWLNGDALKFANLFSENGEFIVPGHCWQGQPEILTAFREFTKTSTVKTIEISNIVLQNNRAIVEWYWEEQERQTGKISKAEDAIAIDFQGDRIQRWREYIDSESCDR